MSQAVRAPNEGGRQHETLVQAAACSYLLLARLGKRQARRCVSLQALSCTWHRALDVSLCTVNIVAKDMQPLAIALCFYSHVVLRW